MSSALSLIAHKSLVSQHYTHIMGCGIENNKEKYLCTTGFGGHGQRKQRFVSDVGMGCLTICTKNKFKKCTTGIVTECSYRHDCDSHSWQIHE